MWTEVSNELVEESKRPLEMKLFFANLINHPKFEKSYISHRCSVLIFKALGQVSRANSITSSFVDQCTISILKES